MNDVDDVRCSISELVNRYGIEEVKSALNEVMPDHEHMEQKEFRCLCGSRHWFSLIPVYKTLKYM
jgi:hypothetical protein